MERRPGFEPGTEGLQPTASPFGLLRLELARGLEPRSTAYETVALPDELCQHGAARRGRTDDLRLTRSLLYQLS